MIASSNTVAPLKSLTQPDATWRVTFCPRTSVVRADPGPAKPWRGVTGQRPANSNPPSAPARASGDGAWLRAAQHPGAAGDAPDRSRFSWFCLSCVYSRPRKTGQSKPAGRCENPTGSAERPLGLGTIYAVKSTSVCHAGTTDAELALGAPSASTVVREVFEQGVSQLYSQFSTFRGNPLQAEASRIPNPGAAFDADFLYRVSWASWSPCSASSAFFEKPRKARKENRAEDILSPFVVFVLFVVLSFLRLKQTQEDRPVKTHREVRKSHWERRAPARPRDDFHREINVSLSCRHNRCRTGARRSQCVHRDS